MHACAGSKKTSVAELAARKAARDSSFFSWKLSLVLGLLLLLLWARLVPHLPWLQQEVTKWHSLVLGGTANPKPT